MNSNPTSGYILIIANSGRMLAQAAQHIGFKPLVIDLFADRDTQTYAADSQQVPALTITCLAPALDYFLDHYAVKHLIYGSGFETHPDSLFYLQSRLILFGNTPDVFRRLQDKSEFFTVLKQLSIPYPETVFSPPHDNQDWLIKPLQGQGGVGIQYAEDSNRVIKQCYFDEQQRPFRFLKPERSKNTNIYWQKYQQGSTHSVLFLGDGSKAQVIGFNSQWTTRLSDSEEFIFAGIINHCPVANRQKAQVTHWLTQLVPVFKLMGLNSLDFIHHNGQNYALEINARPPASMQLYAPDLLRSHIKVGANSFAASQTSYTGYQIVYAPQDIQIPVGYIWQQDTMDLPAAGQLCRTGQPICSIIARQSSPQAVLDTLNLQQHSLYRSLLS